MSANSSLNHITAAYPVNGLGDAPSSQSENDDRRSEAYVHPSWSAAERVCRDPIVFWDIVDDHDGL